MAYKGAAVIGVDLGTCDSVIAYVGKAMIDVVQNEVSQRKTPTLVGFNDRERLLGDAAATVIKSNFKNTVRYTRHLMGPIALCREDVEKEREMSLAEFVEDLEDGTLGFRVNYQGESRVYSATQVCAMFLTKVKTTAENWCNANVTDLVVSVPSYYSDFQRQAIIDAGAISGLNILRTMNEHSATAMPYGIYRTNDFDAEKPMNVVFAHMGHSAFSISVASFTKQKGVVIAEASDRHCAGRDMDWAMMRHFAAEFSKKFGTGNPLKNKKCMLKMEDAVAKCKKQLSANVEAPINIECLMEDEDLSSSMSRDKFEELCADMIARVNKTIGECLEKSKIPVEEISAVEIIGGACRVPWFQKCLTDKFKMELSKTLNADECVARGCALQAAIISPLYSVREFKVVDYAPHDVTLSWKGVKATAAEEKDPKAKETASKDEALATANADDEYKMQVFEAQTDKQDVAKFITCWMKEGPFTMTASTKDGVELGKYEIKFPPQEVSKKVKIEAKLTKNGIFKIGGATMIETEEYEEVTKEKREIVEAEEAGSPEKDGEKSPEKKEAAESSESSKETSKSPSGSDSEKKEEEKKEKKYEWVPVTKLKKRTKKTPLGVGEKDVPGLGEHMQEMKDVESKLISDSRDAKENDDRRNQLETYTYDMKEKVIESSGQYHEYMAAEERTTFDKALEDAREWLYDEYDATTLQIVEKLEQLEAVGAPCMKRLHDREIVAQYITENVDVLLRDVRNACSPVNEQFSHIAEEKKQAVLDTCTELESWIAEKRAADNVKPLYENPSFKIKELRKRSEEVRKNAEKVFREPKPAPPKEEAAPEAGPENAAADDTAATADEPMPDVKEAAHEAAAPEATEAESATAEPSESSVEQESSEQPSEPAGADAADAASTKEPAPKASTAQDTSMEVD